MLMPLWMKVYCLIFILIIVSNISLNFKFKVKPLITVYEILSALYMLYVIYAFWTPTEFQKLNIFHVIAFGLVLAADITFTVWGDFSLFAKNLPPVEKKEQEIAKVVSIIVASPAYITGILAVLGIIC